MNAGSLPKDTLLRIAVVRDGKIIDERRLRTHEPISIGRARRCTFSIDVPDLPEEHILFARVPGNLTLRFTHRMSGRIAGDGRPPLELERVAPHALREGDAHAVVLSTNSRGKISMGRTSVLFQVLPPIERADVSPDFRWSALSAWDWQFAIIVMVVLLVTVSVTAYARSLPYVEPTIEAAMQRGDWVSIAQFLDGFEPPEAPPPATVETKARSATPEATKRAPTRGPATPVEALAGARRGGALDALLAEGSGNVGELLADATTVDDGAFVLERRGEGGLRAEEMDAFGGLERRRIDIGDKSGERVPTSVEAEDAIIDRGAIDPAAVEALLRGYRSAARACYERALKQVPTLSGKIVVSLSVDAGGEVVGVELSADPDIRNETLTECIRSRARTWRFPPAPDGADVTFSLVFTSAE